MEDTFTFQTRQQEKMVCYGHPSDAGRRARIKRAV